MPSPTHRPKASSTSGRLGGKPATRRGEVKISDPIPSTFTHNALTPEEQMELLEGPMPDRIDAAWPRRNTPVIVDTWGGDVSSNVDFYDNRLSTGPSIMMSSMRSVPSKASLDQSQDKPSGFKATIRRMFGSKRRRPSETGLSKDCHKSDPGNLMAVGDLPADRNSPRASPRPRSAPRDNLPALRPKAGSVDTQIPGLPFAERAASSHKRRNSLPSLALSEQEQQNFSKSLKNLLGVDIDHIVRDDRVVPRIDKHRSKSAGALTERFLAEQVAITQQRDLESHFPSRSSGTDADQLSDPAFSMLEQAIPGSRRERVKEVPSLEQIIKPAQSFDFGLSSLPEATSDLEERVNTLEVKLFDFEYAIARLQGVEIPKPILPTKRIRQKSVHEVFSQPSMQSLTSSSSACDKSLPSREASPIISPIIRDSFGLDRTSKATTVRPLRETKSQQSMAGDRTSYHLSPGQFDALMNMIQDEQAARQQMEMHIMDLQREVHLLQSPVYAEINYPIPSPDSAKTVPVSHKRLHRSPPFRLNKVPVHETSRFSMTESEAESFDEKLAEPFQTPQKRTRNVGTSRESPLVGVVS